ncbi:MAG: Crp/Fnr family transcriptional regulator [Bacteroidales bacterium]|nr:Crp/Fnr family transcriptional regulator [Candidatus Latescibacterota bacterium]
MSSRIRDAEIFRGLDEEILAEIENSGVIRKFEKGDFIFFEGRPGDELFILLEGRIKLTKTSADGREITVKFLEPPENFAEIVLFESNRYPTNAQAIADSSIFCMTRGMLMRMLEKPEFRNSFIAMLMKKQRYLAERILYLTSYDVEARFFMFLSENYGIHEKYKIELSKKDIASSIGTIPETFSRLITRLKEKGFIAWEKDHLTLTEGFWDKRGNEYH